MSDATDDRYGYEPGVTTLADAELTTDPTGPARTIATAVLIAAALAAGTFLVSIAAAGVSVETALRAAAGAAGSSIVSTVSTMALTRRAAYRPSTVADLQREASSIAVGQRETETAGRSLAWSAERTADLAAYERQTLDALGVDAFPTGYEVVTEQPLDLDADGRPATWAASLSPDPPTAD